jgi:hypothetical protein
MRIVKFIVRFLSFQRISKERSDASMKNTFTRKLLLFTRKAVV